MDLHHNLSSMRFHEIDLSKRIESGDVALVCGDASPYVEKVTANPAITLADFVCRTAYSSSSQGQVQLCNDAVTTTSRVNCDR
jgi:hypothetical protein